MSCMNDGYFFVCAMMNKNGTREMWGMRKPIIIVMIPRCNHIMDIHVHVLKKGEMMLT